MTHKNSNFIEVKKQTAHILLVLHVERYVVSLEVAVNTD